MPGFAGGAARARRPRVDHARARPHAGEGAPRAALRRAGLRRPLVLAAQGGARRVHGPRPGVRHRRGAPAARARSLLRDRPARRPRALQLRPRHLRRGRHLPPRGLRRLRPAVGPLGGDVGAPAGRAPSRRDPLARPVRRRARRRAARVHREPVVRPAPRARRPRGLARARAPALAGAGVLTDDEAQRGASPRSIRSSVELARRRLRVRAVRRGHPHRDRAAGHRARGRRGRQAPHRPQPQRPGRHRAAAVPPA